MKVLVADRIAAAGVAFFKDQDGFEVIEAYGSAPEKLPELVPDVHAIVVRSDTKVTAEVIAAAKELKVVGRAGVGVDNIDIAAATERGVVVMNTPGGNTIATAELSFTHLLCLARPILQAHASITAGKWDRKSFKGTELFNKTLGVLGLGRVGAEVAKRARAFGMQVLAYDPYVTRERAEALEVEPAGLEAIYAQADYITIHMPRTDETRGLINAAAIAKMKDGVRIVNCARGGIVNEADLAEALKSGKVAGAGLDVYEKEPPPEDSPLRGCPNLSLTPHLGASTAEAQEGVGIQVAEQITRYLKNNEVINAINMPSLDPRELKALQPYLELGEKLGTLIQKVTPAQVAKLKISYWGKIVDMDALPVTRSIQRGYLKNISEKDVNDVNAGHFMKRLGIEVEAVKSSMESDYTELVSLEAAAPEGETFTIAGTLIGKSQKPRMIELLGHEVEFAPEGHLLILENRDVPGIVGKVGTILGNHKINIANMSLSRFRGGSALYVIQLDSAPGPEIISEITAQDDILAAHVVEL